MQPDTLMLFAAGRGTRMGALTATRPKPLIEVAGRALIDHALDHAEGLRRVVVNAHHHAAMLTAHLEGRPELIVSHEPELLDTGAGLRAALPLLGVQTVFTLNSDAVWTGPNPLETLAAVWDSARMDALLLLVPIAQARGDLRPGDFDMSDDGRIGRGEPLRYTGAQILNTACLRDFPDPVFSLNLVWDRLISSERAYGVLHPGGWCDVGHPGGISEAEMMLSEARDA